MIAVMFEVWPRDEGRAAYLATAAALKAELQSIDGFLSVERFESLSEPGKLLSLSFFRDEAALADWRQRPDHRRAQAVGRGGMFADYRIRVAAVVRDYGLNDRSDAPAGAWTREGIGAARLVFDGGQAEGPASRSGASRGRRGWRAGCGGVRGRRGTSRIPLWRGCRRAGSGRRAPFRRGKDAGSAG